MEQTMKRTIAVACATGLIVAVVSAQDQDAAKRRVIEAADAPSQASTTNLRVAIETRVTRGKPYSAEAVNEFVQTLADGNRIVRKTSARVFRDSEGRTRREELGDSNAAPKAGVTISDPVAGSSFILDPTTRTAIKTPGMFAKVDGGSYTVTARGGGAGFGSGAGAGARGAEAKVQVFTTTERPDGQIETKVAAEAAARGGATVVAAGRGGRVMVAGPALESTREELGEQNVEGVNATGTRTTTVIPAGALGNEQPITITSEQWFSPDLDALVLTKHNDPRVGETTYRLINISRNEPDSSLFQVPSDYTVQQRTPVMLRQKQQ
jgi:hypothetical protein